MKDNCIEFLVYFEIYGKKMKTEVRATNEQQAINIVKSNILIHKVERILKSSKENCGDYDLIKELQKLMGMRG